MTLRSLITNCRNSQDWTQIIELLEGIDAECKKIRSDYGKKGPIAKRLDKIRAIALELKKEPNKIMSTPIQHTIMRRRFRPVNARASEITRRKEYMQLKNGKCNEMLVLDNEIGAILKREFNEAES